jgi:glycosyltransferase involved in cell wall biosynthesis
LGSPAVQAALEAHRGLRDRIVVTGYAPDADVAALMAGCACFVYPSLYEGFGLPVLEAMALGAPVVTSNTSSLPEVAGDAALLVDPRSTDAIAGALRRVLADPALGSDLRGRGRERARLFSWERCAAEHLQAYRDAAAA